MSKEMVKHVVSLLNAGRKPLFRLSVRKGRDTLLIRVVSTDSYRFQCVPADPNRNETFLLSHNSVEHGTFILEEMEEVQTDPI